MGHSTCYLQRQGAVILLPEGFPSLPLTLPPWGKGESLIHLRRLEKEPEISPTAPAKRPPL